ncbi:MAG TPA: OmpH family outer membrane protein [Thermohalobaculum sp.]|nr:OmpH family outer membrane protein [Thermohalobaculum sp.]
MALALLTISLAPVAAQTFEVLVVSRGRLLNETEAARSLLKAEIELTAELQRRVDAVKAELTAEEEELTRLRATLARDTFAARVAQFDRKVRTERRQTQRRAAALQNVFREARLKLLEQLGPVLEAVRVDRGASVIINSDQALAGDPAIDVTDEVIARVNSDVPMPEIPDINSIEEAAMAAPDPAQPDQQ